uniref:Uncharacterized protein n=1 Tax=Cyanophora biloba TaxID=1489483 RepID=A0A2Z4HH31_9EUKA|nr:hypothetical protein [Cyanophora biloba]AWW13894.1 hypothetical protein [Cyanophora biloba]
MNSKIKFIKIFLIKKNNNKINIPSIFYRIYIYIYFIIN